MPASTRSPTELSTWLACRRASALDAARREERIAGPSGVDPTRDLLRERGALHEARYLQQLRDAGLGVIELRGCGVEATMAAMRERVDAIAQATLAASGWSGVADVLVRVDAPSELGDWSYEVHDTKLAKETKVGTIVQLAVYSELLAALQGARPERFWVVVLLVSVLAGLSVGCFGARSIARDVPQACRDLAALTSRPEYPYAEYEGLEKQCAAERGGATPPDDSASAIVAAEQQVVRAAVLRREEALAQIREREAARIEEKRHAEESIAEAARIAAAKRAEYEQLLVSADSLSKACRNGAVQADAHLFAVRAKLLMFKSSPERDRAVASLEPCRKLLRLDLEKEIRRARIAGRKEFALDIEDEFDEANPSRKGWLTATVKGTGLVIRMRGGFEGRRRHTAAQHSAICDDAEGLFTSVTLHSSTDGTFNCRLTTPKVEAVVLEILTEIDAAKPWTSPVAGDLEVPADPKATPEPEIGTETVGVGKCDEYVRKYLACAEKARPEARAQMREAATNTIELWKESLRAGDGASLARTCETAMQQAEKLLVDLGCEW